MHCAVYNQCDWSKGLLGLMLIYHYSLFHIGLAADAESERVCVQTVFLKSIWRWALGKLLLLIYYFAAEDSQRRTALFLSLNPSLVTSIYRWLQDVCSRDLQERPIITFGGPGTVAKCDESKFKITFNSTFVYYLRPLSQTFNCTCFVLRTKNTRSNLSDSGIQ